MQFDPNLSNVGSDLIVAGTITFAACVGRWFRNMRKLVAYAAKQMANDGNGSWRSNIDKRLTAIETALPGVMPQPEGINSPPSEK